MPTKVLLIDDDASLRALARRMLDAMPELEIIEASDGASGFSLFCEHQPGLVITDIMMPVQDGLETIRRIKQVKPQARIIAVSGGGGAVYADPLGLALQMGACAAIEKPFRKAHLVAAATRALAEGA